MTVLERRLQAELVARDSKIRELEEALAKCAARGIRLDDVLTYARDEEPTHDELVKAINQARKE